MGLNEVVDFLSWPTVRVIDDEEIPYSMAYILDPVTNRIL